VLRVVSYQKDFAQSRVTGVERGLTSLNLGATGYELHATLAWLSLVFATT
jgi:hypothetical protein